MPRISLPCPTWLDAALCALIFVLTALPYLNSLEGAMCYDDKVAVGGNPDVVLPNVTLRSAIESFLESHPWLYDGSIALD